MTFEEYRKKMDRAIRHAKNGSEQYPLGYHALMDEVRYVWFEYVESQKNEST
jgi:hypothetical protein